MYCSKCGTKIVLPDAIFCHKCGQRLVITNDAGTVIGGNVATGGGDFIGRDVLNKLSLLFSNSGGCITVTIVRVSIVLLCILLGTLLYQNPEVRTAVQRVWSEIKERLIGDANITSPEVLPRPTASTTFTKSVGTNQESCESGETDTITVSVGITVFYCYSFEATQAITLTRYRIVDKSLGDVMEARADSPHTFVDPALYTTRDWLTETTVSSATWIGYNPNDHPIITATDTTTVNVIPASSP